MEAQADRLHTCISMIKEELDIDERIRLLKELNTSLPAEKRIALPSLITHDYVSKAVDIIEETTYPSYKR